MSMNIDVGVEPASLLMIRALAQADGLLASAVGPTTAQVAQLLADRIVSESWSAFQNPSGALASSVMFGPDSVTVPVPYAQRLEFGFSGQTDALGRYYPVWPAEPYVAPAMESLQSDIGDAYQMAINDALGRVALA